LFKQVGIVKSPRGIGRKGREGWKGEGKVGRGGRGRGKVSVRGGGGVRESKRVRGRE
jgi:hypothetical protein